jgi:hypothetical protein
MKLPFLVWNLINWKKILLVWKHVEPTPRVGPKHRSQKKKKVFNKTPNFSLSSLFYLQWRVISAECLYKVQREACMAQRNVRIASAVRAGHGWTSRTLAMLLLILLLASAKPLIRVGAAPFVSTSVLWDGWERVALLHDSNFGAASALLISGWNNCRGVKSQQIIYYSHAPLHRCHLLLICDTFEVVVAKFRIRLAHPQHDGKHALVVFLGLSAFCDACDALPKCAPHLPCRWWILAKIFSFWWGTTQIHRASLIE